MNDFINFFKDIFMIREIIPNRIGLSQFKETATIEQVPKQSIRSKDIKLSDLMKRS